MKEYKVIYINVDKHLDREINYWEYDDFHQTIDDENYILISKKRLFALIKREIKKQLGKVSKIEILGIVEIKPKNEHLLEVELNFTK